MRTTTILNLKGGVGKTTTLINMAAILAKGGARVLVIDGDSQCNTTAFFGGNADGYPTTADLLRTGPDGVRPVGTNVADIHLLAGDETLMDLDLTKAESGRLQLYSLRNFLQAGSGSGYDFALIDCPPAFHAATAAALLASDDVIIPMKLDAFSINGMTVLFRQIENMRRINPDLKISGILPTMYYRSQRNSAALAEIRKARLPIFHPIRRSETVDRMTYLQEPLTMCSTRSGALRDYRTMVGEYYQQGEQ